MLRGIFRTKNLDDILAALGDETHSLKRTLGALNVTLLGIGAIIGAGIFATVGTAAAGDAARPGAGPSLMLSFCITAIVCAFTALCYAEMAAMVPISGSAYTYSYATLGELVAWIIGWDLILEYAIGNVAVAISWANYFRSLLESIGIDIPQWLSTDFRTARKIPGLIESAPHILGVPIVFNLLAFGIVTLITIVLVWGIKESAQFNAVMVGIKILVLLFFIVVALYFVSPAKMVTNWHPFMPNGFSGTLAGAAVVFFAYIGFDAVSTVAEETKNPARDLPIGIIASLIICTIFYVVVAAVFTGLIPYSELVRRLATEQAEPLTMALQHVAPNANWATGIVAFGSVVAHTAVLLVFQLGQPRIFFSMARDGLLPPVFAKVHPKFKTPHVTTILTGVVVGGFAAVMSIDEMVDLTNIGTLFAFVLVCVGIIILRYRDPDRSRPFKVPSGTVWAVLAGIAFGVFGYFAPGILAKPESLPGFMSPPTWQYIEPIVFLILAILVAYLYPRSVLGKRLPIGAWGLPLLGAASCLFLMVYLPPTSWWRFIAWLMIGLSIYLSYGYAKSELGRKVDRPRTTPGWLMLAGLGSFLIAVGILAIPHHASLSELSAEMSDGNSRTILSVGSIGLGVLLCIIGMIVGKSKD